MRRYRTLATVLLALACSWAGMPAARAQGDLILGMSAAFTGASANLGLDLYQGSMAYFAHLNANGGIHGSRVRIQAYDDVYDPNKAILNSIKLIEQDEALLLFNYVGTPTVTRVLPVLSRFHERQILLFFPFTGAQPQRTAPYGRFAFNLRASYRDETAQLVDHYVSQGRRRIGILYQVDAYGRSGWDGVSAALKRHGLSIAAEATYRRGTPYADSMQAQVDILRKAKVDAVIAIAAYAASAAFVRDAVNAGWDIPIANVSFVGSESMLQLLLGEQSATGRDYTRGLLNSQVVPSYEDLSLPAVREYRDYVNRYRPAPPDGFGGGATAPQLSFVGFEGFLNAKLLAHMLSSIPHRPARGDLRAAMERVQALDLGIQAPVSFSSTRNQGLDKVYFTHVEGDRFVPFVPGGTKQ
jgi:branched-chain amino acid transport system substrate-binding protein